MSATNSSEQGQVPERASLDESKIAYQRPQPFGMVPDAFVGSALDLGGDEREWVPQSPTLSFKPLMLSGSQGFYINILRVRSSGVLSRHRHTGPVHALTLGLNDKSLLAGDGAAVSDVPALHIAARVDGSEFLLFDLP